MKLKGSQAEKNLLAAFAGESQARNRYTYFSSQAREEGYMQISAIFEETTNQEKEHAKREFKFLQGGGDGGSDGPPLPDLYRQPFVLPPFMYTVPCLLPY